MKKKKPKQIDQFTKRRTKFYWGPPHKKSDKNPKTMKTKNTISNTEDAFFVSKKQKYSNTTKLIDGLVSLFNGISTLFRLFNAKAILLEEVVLFNPKLGG